MTIGAGRARKACISSVQDYLYQLHSAQPHNIHSHGGGRGGGRTLAALPTSEGLEMGRPSASSLSRWRAGPACFLRFTMYRTASSLPRVVRSGHRSTHARSPPTAIGSPTQGQSYCHISLITPVVQTHASENTESFLCSTYLTAMPIPCCNTLTTELWTRYSQSFFFSIY